jgi:hypothetical protein
VRVVQRWVFFRPNKEEISLWSVIVYHKAMKFWTVANKDYLSFHHPVAQRNAEENFCDFIGFLIGFAWLRWGYFVEITRRYFHSSKINRRFLTKDWWKLWRGRNFRWFITFHHIEHWVVVQCGAEKLMNYGQKKHKSILISFLFCFYNIQNEIFISIWEIYQILFAATMLEHEG